MRKASVVVMVVAMFLLGTALPAAGVPGTGDLNKAFHAGLSSDQIDPNPVGRIKPFAGYQAVCDQQVVGVWIFWQYEKRDQLAGITNEFVLDGVRLDTQRTGAKRVAGPAKDWWFAEGVPVLGVLAPGLHTVEWTFVDPNQSPDPFTVVTEVHVDAGHC